jgi:hypothetical protein
MNPKQIGIGILLIAIIGVAVYQFSNTVNNTKVTTNTQAKVAEITATPITEQSPSTSESTMAATYKNGTYEGIGHYTSPAQQEEVNISITLKDGVVTDATFTGHGTNPTTKKMQGLFTEGFKDEVVGKPIDEINLNVVNGSSLTPKGFMDALQQVKQEAKA